MPDVEEGSEGKVREPFRGIPLKADDETDVQGCRMVGEKCGLARISHQHSCRTGHSVLPDVEEGSEGKVREPFRGIPLKADDETDVQGCRMVGEKCGLEPRQV